MYRQLVSVVSNASMAHLTASAHVKPRTPMSASWSKPASGGRFGFDHFYALNPIRMAVEESEAAAEGQLFAAPDVWLLVSGRTTCCPWGGPRLPAGTGCVHNGMRLVASASAQLRTRPTAVMRVSQTKPPATGSPFNAVRQSVITTPGRRRKVQQLRLPGIRRPMNLLVHDVAHSSMSTNFDHSVRQCADTSRFVADRSRFEPRLPTKRLASVTQPDIQRAASERCPPPARDSDQLMALDADRRDSATATKAMASLHARPTHGLPHNVCRRAAGQEEPRDQF